MVCLVLLFALSCGQVVQCLYGSLELSSACLLLLGLQLLMGPVLFMSFELVLHVSVA